MHTILGDKEAKEIVNCTIGIISEQSRVLGNANDEYGKLY